MQGNNEWSPYNPAYPPSVTPDEYERQVVDWLQRSGSGLEDFKVRHLEHLSGSGGDYEFDAIAKFTIFGGARVIVLVECKRYSKPVKRDLIMTLWAKKQDVKAHKAMMFATCGFQSGALTYAKEHGIATIIFTEGKFSYETKAYGATPHYLPWLPKFHGILLRKENHITQCFSIEDTDALYDWLNHSE